MLTQTQRLFTSIIDTIVKLHHNRTTYNLLQKVTGCLLFAHFQTYAEERAKLTVQWIVCSTDEITMFVSIWRPYARPRAYVELADSLGFANEKRQEPLPEAEKNARGEVPSRAVLSPSLSLPLFFVNCGRTVSLSVKPDLDPPSLPSKVKQ